jgi:hypothetical protein
MPEMAASGLWTTPSDFARLVIALIESYNGKEDCFLSTPLARQMMTEVGVSRFGLGPKMRGLGLQRVFFHVGSNNSYNAHIEGHLATGNGLVTFTNGANGSDLNDEIRRAVAEAEGWTVACVVMVPKIELTDDAMQELTGIYAVQPSGTLSSLRMRSNVVAYEVRVREGSVHIGSPGNDEAAKLIPESPTTFVDAEYGERHVEFVRDYTGRVSALLVREGGYAVEAVKAP